MKTFASVLLIAALVSAKKMPKVEPVPEPQTADDLYWADITQKTAYGRNLWLGVYQGLYGMSTKIERPDENCFGDWIPSHM